MEEQEQDIALLEAYLDGTLSGEELRAFEARLQAQPDLAATLEMLRALEPAVAQAAQASLKTEFKAAQAAAIAAGMASYAPALNPPPQGGSFLGKLFRFLVTLGILGGTAWVLWKYVLHEQWPPRLSQSTTKVEAKTETRTTKTIIRHDTILSQKPMPVLHGQ